MNRYATNEWSKLKTVIVGTATGARIPQIDISVRTVNYADKSDDELKQIITGLYPQSVIDEANEDLETFANFLKGEGVKVLRPKQVTPVEYYDYCPRDIVFVHGELALATPNPIRARFNNYENIEHCFDTLVKPLGKPTDEHYNLGCVGDPDILALKESKPLFDAANVIRANDKLMYLVSNSGNKAGAQMLGNLLPDVSIHLLENVYSYMHIDSTVAFLREGLMLCNPTRVKSRDMLPEGFRDWDIIWCPEPTDIGYYGDYCNASEWINMNLFSVSEELVVLEKHQENLARELNRKGIETALLPTRHQRTLGGGFHCVTLDLEREC